MSNNIGLLYSFICIYLDVILFIFIYNLYLYINIKNYSCVNLFNNLFNLLKNIKPIIHITFRDRNYSFFKTPKPTIPPRPNTILKPQRILLSMFLLLFIQLLITFLIKTTRTL